MNSQTPKSVADNFMHSDLLEAMPDAVTVVGPEGIIVQVNSQTEALFGYTKSELIGQKVEMLVPERQRGQHIHHRERFREQPNARRMGAGLELYGRRRDGSEFPVEISLSPVVSKDGTMVLSAIRDVSDRKRIEEQLRHAYQELDQRKDRQLWDYQNRLALIVDSTQDAVIGKTLDGVVTHWNKGAERIYGYSSNEMIGKSISILAPPNRRDEISGILEQIRRGETLEHFESVRVAKDGQHLNVSLTVSPVYDTTGSIVGASTIARDITAQKKTEDQLRQAQKMEAVGRLAGGVAHDFNNILGIIIACSELLHERMGSSDIANIEFIENIRKAADRGASLTKQLLSFSRKQPARRSVLDLNERIRETSKLLRPLMGDDVQIAVVPRSRSAIVEADPGQLDQIVLNLAMNARDAMPRGGKLIIETENQDLDDAFTRLDELMTPGKFVMMAVSDNGCGMDQATASRIFDPFFTTKEVGKGTGLGLSTVYGIVKQSGGTIRVYSEPGHGTTFKIYFPSADHKLGVAAESKAESLPPRHDGTTILLVEDDEMMRKVTRKLLEEHGYTVFDASDGKSALQHLASRSAPIDLTLTDVVMRGMSGPELALQLIDSQPKMRIVYMSGYTRELLSSQDTVQSGITLLEKPFTRVSLLNTIHAALA